MYIYKIDIPATGQCYIGQTKRPIEVRFNEHKNPNSISLIGRAIQHWGNPKIILITHNEQPTLQVVYTGNTGTLMRVTS